MEPDPDFVDIKADYNEDTDEFSFCVKDDQDHFHIRVTSDSKRGRRVVVADVKRVNSLISIPDSFLGAFMAAAGDKAQQVIEQKIARQAANN